MSDLVVNVAKVAFVGALYLFLFFVAAAVRSHLSAAPRPQSDGGPAPPPAPVPTLVLHGEDGGARTVEVKGEVVVGRDPDADVVIDDDFASGRHARFRISEGRPVVIWPYMTAAEMPMPCWPRLCLRRWNFEP